MPLRRMAVVLARTQADVRFVTMDIHLCRTNTLGRIVCPMTAQDSVRHKRECIVVIHGAKIMLNIQKHRMQQLVKRDVSPIPLVWLCLLGYPPASIQEIAFSVRAELLLVHMLRGCPESYETEADQVQADHAVLVVLLLIQFNGTESGRDGQPRPILKLVNAIRILVSEKWVMEADINHIFAVPPLGKIRASRESQMIICEFMPRMK